jgi:hypothetical protein
MRFCALLAAVAPILPLDHVLLLPILRQSWRLSRPVAIA